MSWLFGKCFFILKKSLDNQARIPKLNSKQRRKQDAEELAQLVYDMFKRQQLKINIENNTEDLTKEIKNV